MSVSRCNAGRTLKTSQEKTLSISTNGGIEGMSKLKAKVGDTWITATSVQQLVDKALQRKTEQEATSIETVPTVQDYCNNYMATFRAKGTIAENTRIGYLGYLKNHI